MGGKESREGGAAVVDSEQYHRVSYRAYTRSYLYKRTAFTSWDHPGYLPYRRHYTLRSVHYDRPPQATADQLRPFSVEGTEQEVNLPPPVPDPRYPLYEEEAERDDSNEPLKITDLDLMKEANTTNHHTHQYDTDKVVLRRGGHFRVRFQVSRKLSKIRHALNIEFRRGRQSSFYKGSRFESRIERTSARDWEWKGRVEKVEGLEVEVAVEIPADAPVGEYNVIAEAVDLKTGRQENFTAAQNVVILFNPWSEDDGVYMEDDADRNEYISCESGRIWAGAYKAFHIWPWEFEQFESTTLEAALQLLDSYSTGSDLRRSPVHVSRVLTSMVNANDNDGGIMIGNWSGDYADGTSPMAWSGSGAILEQYLQTKRAVKYAQCWVFGGVLTSVLRSLGIPARPVTNFVSAHDTDANRAIDFYFDENAEKIEHLSGDSIWNYHVWVEAWMERPDLKGHYGGWQALDATPQEPSPHSGVFTLGPAPVAAIKEGAARKYDTEFVISEVNADVNMHIQKPGGEFRLARSNTRKVGKVMMTKAVGSAEGVDVIANYKHTEGTAEERVTLDSGGTEQEALQDDITVDIVAFDDIMVGEELHSQVLLKSTAREDREVKCVIKLHPVSYVGALGKLIGYYSAKTTIAPGATVEVPISLPPSEYIGKVRDQLMVNISAFVTVKETESVFVDKETFCFKTPNIALSVKDQVRVGESEMVTASFKNPLDVSLSNVEWFVEGAGLTKPLKIVESPVPAGGEASTTFTISPKNTLEPVRTLTVTFESDQLEGVMGHTQVQVVA